jgi:hypothetical protein
MTLTYHAGQVEVQTEANSRPAADMLAERTSGRSERTLTFYAAADLVVIATPDAMGVLRFVAVSGAPPLLTPFGQRDLVLPKGAPMADGAPVGAIAIDLAQRRRARANGRIEQRGALAVLEADEELVNCRKYIAPSVALEEGPHWGPAGREAVAASDAGLLRALAGLETAFLATLSPARQPDVSHKGGPRGFMTYDASARQLSWPELIGNGMFKSAGNVRATGVASVLALDLASGDAYELSGRAEYRTELRYGQPRESGLWPSETDYPTQGVMTLQIDEVQALRAMIVPRRGIEAAAKVTACSPVEDQRPR